MTLRAALLPRWVGLAAAGFLVAAACAATPTAAPTASPSPAPSETPSATPTSSPGPIESLPAGCAEEASGLATEPRVSIRDIATQAYPDYDVLVFDFDRGLPEYTISRAEPPFSADPSGEALTVHGSSFFSVVLRGASIVDDEFLPIYEGPTILEPGLTRIEHVILAGDFEAVSSWIVGLRGAACLAVQAFSGDRLVIAFVDAPS